MEYYYPSKFFNGCILCDYLLYDFVRSTEPTPPTSDATPGESRDLYLTLILIIPVKRFSYFIP